MNSSDLLTLLALAALAVAIIKWPRLRQTLRFPSSSNWPIISATVEQVLVHSYSGRGGTTTYRAEVVYSYQIDGEYYGGRYMGDLMSSETDVDDLVRATPKGTTLQIHVHPTRPQLSVLSL